MVFEIFENFIYQGLWTLLLILVGILVIKFVERIVFQFFEKIKLKSTFKLSGLEDTFLSVGLKFDIQKILTEIIKLFFVFLFLMALFEIFNLQKVSEFFEFLVKYYLNVFLALLIFLAALYFFAFSKKIVLISLEKEKISVSPILGKGITFFIWVLALLAILYQLNILKELILILFAGLVGLGVLIIGIAFGLGGKELAQKFLQEIQEKFKK
jgi:hypothetical protein